MCMRPACRIHWSSGALLRGIKAVYNRIKETGVHILIFWARYGVYVVKTWEKIDWVTAPHCMQIYIYKSFHICWLQETVSRRHVWCESLRWGGRSTLHFLQVSGWGQTRWATGDSDIDGMLSVKLEDICISDKVQNGLYFFHLSYMISPVFFSCDQLLKTLSKTLVNPLLQESFVIWEIINIFCRADPFFPAMCFQEW